MYARGYVPVGEGCLAWEPGGFTLLTEARVVDIGGRCWTLQVDPFDLGSLKYASDCDHQDCTGFVLNSPLRSNHTN